MGVIGLIVSQVQSVGAWLDPLAVGGWRGGGRVRLEGAENQLHPTKAHSSDLPLHETPQHQVQNVPKEYRQL